MYEIVFTRSALKDLKNLPEDIAARIMLAIDMLAKEPYPKGCVKLKGDEYNNAWRIRVGDYRVLYRVFEEDELIRIGRIIKRGDAYKRKLNL